MATLGTHYQPDMMLIGADGAAIAHPEWVVRMPNFLLTVLGMYLLYKGVAQRLRPARGPARRARARHDARLVLPRAPDDDRHALRRADDAARWGCSCSASHTDAENARSASTRSTRRQVEGSLLRLAPGLRRHLRSARCRRSSTCSRATSSWSLHGDGPHGLPLPLGRVQERLGHGQLRPARQRGVRRREPRVHPEGRGHPPRDVQGRDAALLRRLRAVAAGPRVERRPRADPLPELGRAARAPPLLPRRMGSSRRSPPWPRAPRASRCRCSAASRTWRPPSAGASSCASRS